MFLQRLLRPAPLHYRLASRPYASVVAAKERPVPVLSLKQLPLEQLSHIANYSLWSLREGVHEKSLSYPYERINKIPSKIVDELLTSFEGTLASKLASYFQNNQHHDVSNLTLTDYFKPRTDIIAPLIYLVHLNMYPSDLAALRGYNTKSDIITALLTELFHQHYIESTLINVPLSQTQEKLESTWDIGNPAEWYPQARKMKRKIIMHVGPTNSGKTFNSLKAFAAAKSGYYAGPLRLLAREIYERFNADGIPCNLITGEEVIPRLDEYGNLSTLSSGTIEMIPLHKKMDICIIDEIQMIADTQRGSAWTNAVLGVQAKEVHLCGEESAVNLIKEMLKSTGDELEVKKYDRLGKLTVLDKPVGRLANLQKGDCLVVFSKRKILELKCEIEQTTDLKVGVIYGALPPEIRTKEANNFNSGKYDVLVASDAVGMGLNLKIKRIVFWSVKKFNGTESVPLTVSATKQIAGRAGRFSALEGELEGFVTAIYLSDMARIRRSLQSPIENLEKACVWPPNEFWIHYMSSFPKPIPLHTAMRHLEAQAGRTDLKHYFLTEFTNQLSVLEHYMAAGLHYTSTIEDQLTLAQTPLNFTLNGELELETVLKYFASVLQCSTKTIFDYGFVKKSLLEKNATITSSKEQVFATLDLLEVNHKLVLVFLWLSQRFPTLFADKESASDMKTLIEKRISEELVVLRRISGNRTLETLGRPKRNVKPKYNKGKNERRPSQR